MSMDAGLFGAWLGLDDAYRFACSDEVKASSGYPARLARPLDWLVIVDHSDGMGYLNDSAHCKPEILKFEQGKRCYDVLQEGGQAQANASSELITALAQGDVKAEMMTEYSLSGRMFSTIWDDVNDAAERYNVLGNFMTLIGYEWTTLVVGNNMHRNVFFRDGAYNTSQIVPFTMQEPLGSSGQLDLYA